MSNLLNHEIEDRNALSLLEQLANVPYGPEFGATVRRVLGPANYAHMCKDWGGGSGSSVPCELCGQVGHADLVGDWCYTDVRRLPYKSAERIHNALAGVEGKFSEVDLSRRMDMPILLEIVHREPNGAPVPWPLSKHLPHPSVVPALTADQVEGGGRHYHPSQHIDRESVRYPPNPNDPRFKLPLFNDADAQRGAAWLLWQNGWEARKGGKPQKRWLKGKDLRTRLIHKPRRVDEDRWRVVEVAFVLLHPELAPTDEERQQLHVSAEEEAPPAMAMGAALTPEILAMVQEQARIAARQELELEAARAENARLKAATSTAPNGAAPRRRGRPPKINKTLTDNHASEPNAPNG